MNYPCKHGVTNYCGVCENNLEPSMTTPTPETDAEIDAAIHSIEGGCQHSFNYVTVDFARKLKRERDEARADNGKSYGEGVTFGKLEAANYTTEERERYGKWVAENNNWREMKAELNQLHKVVDSFASNIDYCKGHGTPIVKDRAVAYLNEQDYSTLTHVIKAKECRHNNFHYNTFNNKLCSDCGISEEAVKAK